MPSPASRLARLAPALALVVVAAWSARRVVGAGAGVPDDAAWAAAAAEVRAAHQVGELIVIAPGWAEPVGYLHLGDLVPVEMAGRLDAARYPAIWELSIRGARAPETRGLHAASTRTFGGVTVRRFRQAARTVVTDFAPLIGTATVAGKRARGPELVLAEVGFAPHRCAQVVPTPDGAVTMTFADVALGTELAFGVGLADVFTRRDVRDPAELAVAVDGFELARVRVGVDDGWVTRTVVTRPGRGAVTFTARAVGLRAANRLVCFAAEARR
ncbi:MAG: hypothetical protein IPL61_03620 [Myxococcales bacterium]|nr:hypothetical protein [Myxococcales bacterium]